MAEPQQVVKKQRGRETAADMVRSLGLVVLVILPVWFFAKAPASDEATIRVVDPTSTVSAFSPTMDSRNSSRLPVEAAYSAYSSDGVTQPTRRVRSTPE